MGKEQAYRQFNERDKGVATTFWGFASFCGLAFLAVYRLLPETKGLTLEQIEREWK